MRKAALFTAVVLAAALSSSSTFAAGKADPAMQAQKDTNALMSAAMNPGMSGNGSAMKAKGHKKHMKMAKKKSMKKKM
jgi:hypothetical protein